MDKFDISNLNKFKFYLSVEFLSIHKDLFLTQQAYALRILAKFVIKNNNSASILIPKGLKLRKEEDFLCVNVNYN